jgi:NADH-quinone oxidoreductase subunit N
LSCVSLYYYLQVLKQIYVAESPEGSGPLHVNRTMQAAIVALAIAVVGLGCMPDVLLEQLGAKAAEKTATALVSNPGAAR